MNQPNRIHDLASELLYVLEAEGVAYLEQRSVGALMQLRALARSRIPTPPAVASETEAPPTVSETDFSLVNPPEEENSHG